MPVGASEGFSGGGRCTPFRRTAVRYFSVGSTGRFLGGSDLDLGCFGFWVVFGGSVGTILGVGMESTGIPKGEVQATFRSGWIKHFRFALSSAGGAAFILGFFELLQRQPVEGLRLLMAWGPWPLIVLVALALVGRFMSRLSDSLQTTFSAVVQSAQQGAEAQSRTADALTKLADQGGRQAEETRRLSIYAARELNSISERLDRQEEVMSRQDEVMSGVAESVNRLHARLDQREASQ